MTTKPQRSNSAAMAASPTIADARRAYDALGLRGQAPNRWRSCWRSPPRRQSPPGLAASLTTLRTLAEPNDALSLRGRGRAADGLAGDLRLEGDLSRAGGLADAPSRRRSRPLSQRSHVDLASTMVNGAKPRQRRCACWTRVFLNSVAQGVRFRRRECIGPRSRQLH